MGSDFYFVPNPMGWALDELGNRGEEGSRLWCFDYPFEKSNNAAAGCGVSVFIIANSATIYGLMSNSIDFRTVREVIRPRAHNYPTGYTRYYVDWDEPVTEGITLPSNYLIIRIQLLLQHFQSFFAESYDFEILPAFTHRNNKISIHAIFTGLCFATEEAFRLFDKEFIDLSGTTYKRFTDDAKQSEQSLAGPCLAFLRTVGSRKAHRDGILLPIRYDAENCQYTIADMVLQEDFDNYLVWSLESRGDLVFEKNFK
jgi:hypothetical protein